MKILLVYFTHLNYSDIIPQPARSTTGIYPPLGILYIAASLKRYGFPDVKIIDGQTLKNEVEDGVEIIKSYRPDIIGITTFTWTAYKVVQLAARVKELFPHIHINLGGPHLGLYPLETISIPSVDSVTIGDGEHSFPSLVKSIASGALPYDIPGINFKNGRNIVNNVSRDPIRDLDTLPFPDRTLIDISKYFIVSNISKLSTTMISSRGCPYRCIFCNSLDKYYRQRSTKNIVDEMEECVDMGIGTINFVDDSFNATRNRIKNISEEILRRNLKVEWTISARVDKIEMEVLKTAKEAGLSKIAFGIESGNEDILKFIKKNITLQNARHALKICKEAGIKTQGYFVLGYPNETREQIENTISFALELDPDFIQFTPLIPSPGTELYKLALETGGFDHDYFKQYSMNPAGPPVIKYWETVFTHKQIMRIVRSAYRRFYWRPRVFLRTLRNVTNIRQLLRQGKAGLSILRFSLGY